MVNIHSRLARLSFALLVLASTWTSMAATITASVDRNPAQLGESFQFILEVKGSPDGNPDLTPLEKDFDLLGRSQTSSIQVINGKMTKTVQWLLNLMPKHAGEVTIPPIHFGNDTSNPVKIAIIKNAPATSGANSNEIFIKVEAEPKDTWVQAQIIYTVRLYRSVQMTNASLNAPSLSDADAVIEKLGNDKEFDTRVNGIRYRVIERKYAIFPQQSGQLTINPTVFKGEIALASSRFAFDPFARRTKTRHLRSDSININVNPVPGALKNKPWLPASNIKLTEEWSDSFPEFRVGEAVTRTLKLEATGLTAAQLPELSSQKIDGFKRYPDQPHLENNNSSTEVIGIRQEKIALLPTRPGKYVLPEIKVTWWNTKTSQKEIALLPEKNIVVLAANNQQATQTTPLQEIPLITNEPGKSPSSELSDTKLPESTAVSESEIKHAGYWPWISLALATGWLGTFIVMRNKHTNNSEEEKNKPEENIRKSRKEAERKLKQACENNDAPSVKKALLLWGKNIFPDNPPSSLTALSNTVGGDTAEHINRLNTSLYSQTRSEWNGKELWKSIQMYNKNKASRPNRKEEILAPMYPG